MGEAGRGTHGGSQDLRQIAAPSHLVLFDWNILEGARPRKAESLRVLLVSSALWVKLDSKLKA